MGCTLVPFDKVKKLIFHSDDYVDKIRSRGYSLLFYGIDLVDIAERTNSASREGTKKTAYIALDLFAAEDHPDGHIHGCPELPLLLRCLVPWEWSSEGRHTLRLRSSNIELNISIYNHRPPPTVNRWLAAKPLEYAEGLEARAESAVSCANLDLGVAFECYLLNIVGPVFVFRHNFKGQRRSRKFHLNSRKCNCELEQLFSKTSLSEDTTKQKFTELEWAYSQAMFGSGITDSANTTGTQFVFDGAEGATNDAARTKFRFLSAEKQTAILEEIDDERDSHSELHRRYAPTWRAVVRKDEDFMKLLELTGPDNDAFLAGLGVRSLYDAGGHVSKDRHSVLLSWTAMTKRGLINWKTFFRNRATLFDPDILLYLKLPGDTALIPVPRLDDFIEKKDLTIPILYLRNDSIENAAVTYEETNLPSLRHGYSFTVQGMKITMVEEASQSKVAWHLRDDSEDDTADTGREGQGNKIVS